MSDITFSMVATAAIILLMFRDDDRIEDVKYVKVASIVIGALTALIVWGILS